MMGVLERGHTDAARNQARNQLGNQRGFARAAPAGETDNAHGSPYSKTPHWACAGARSMVSIDKITPQRNKSAVAVGPCKAPINISARIRNPFRSVSSRRYNLSART